MTIQETLRQIEALCRAHGASEVLLFGSYADGTARPSSDLDIAVKGCRDMAALEEAVEDLPTIRQIDLVDYDRCRNTLLKEDIDQYGKPISQALSGFLPEPGGPGRRPGTGPGGPLRPERHRPEVQPQL